MQDTGEGRDGEDGVAVDQTTEAREPSGGLVLIAGGAGGVRGLRGVGTAEGFGGVVGAEGVGGVVGAEGVGGTGRTRGAVRAVQVRGRRYSGVELLPGRESSACVGSTAATSRHSPCPVFSSRSGPRPAFDPDFATLARTPPGSPRVGALRRGPMPFPVRRHGSRRTPFQLTRVNFAP
ncbi:hypothetical protein SAV14893_031450 [Streptomyces avermitilis]|uniref:Uncharacterized protein n=1 Tax=Streptomyces avermitilis TaxID=33903 RepID=A0A4D4LR39_STRAX|nr:hypothetical protein SAV14893_031450 [Streptomyces avermitilis]